MTHHLTRLATLALLTLSGVSCARLNTAQMTSAHLTTTSAPGPGARAALIIAAYGAIVGLTYYALDHHFTEDHPLGRECNCNFDSECPCE